VTPKTAFYQERFDIAREVRIGGRAHGGHEQQEQRGNSTGDHKNKGERFGGGKGTTAESTPIVLAGDNRSQGSTASFGGTKSTCWLGRLH
jgi:hypothetical protein